mgnify:CR=1 FL=1
MNALPVYSQAKNLGGMGAVAPMATLRHLTSNLLRVRPVTCDWSVSALLKDRLS